MSLLILICTTTFFGTLHGRTFQNSKDIEEFIDKLLGSEKFEKLAEKIAERAAGKILNLQQINQGEKSDLTLHASESNGPKHDDENKKEKPREMEQDENHTKEKYLDPKDETENLTTDKTKIDTAAAKVKFALVPAEELSLNYKHFTAKEGRHTTSKYTTVRGRSIVYASENERDVGSHQNMIHGRKEESSERSKNMKTSGDAYFNRVHQASDEMKSVTKLSKTEDSSVDDYQKESKEKKPSEGNDSVAISSDKDDSDDATTTTQANSMLDTDDKKKKLRSKKNSSSENNSQKHASESDDSGSHDNEVVIADSETQKADKNVDMRHMVREEDGKMFAFEQSPDYEEYHEKLSKLLRSVQDKNRRKFNLET